VRPFLIAEWRDIAMLNYAADPALVEPFVPRGTEIDFFNGRTYISLVGFQFLRTRIVGIPVPRHQNFPEVNLRIYVRRGDRRGVVFLREIVPKYAVAALARIAYGENYIALPMSSELHGPLVEYRWRYRGCWNALHLETGSEAALPAAGSHEEFVAEHYWGYSQGREYRVEHEPWKIRGAIRARFEGDARELYGAAFGELLAREPDSAFVAEGSAVNVFRPERI